MALVLDRSTTTTQLLSALRDPANHAYWQAFDERFRPIVFGLARRAGLSYPDAADVAQETLIAFARDYQAGCYQRDRGTLRGWIIGIARHRILNRGRKLGRRRGERGESALGGVPDEQTLTRFWQVEEERTIFKNAMHVLRTETKITKRSLAVFEHVALREVPAAEVAEEYEISVDEVYRIRNRLTNRLQGIVKEITAAWEEDAPG